MPQEKNARAGRRVHITMSDELLDQIDAAARRYHQNRSGIIRMAVARMTNPQPPTPTR